jgi:signal transduction histidine kinase
VKRNFYLYLLLVLAPAGVLAALALGVADRDRAEGLRLLDERLAEEAEALARRFEAAFADAENAAARAFAEHREGQGGAVLGFARQGAWAGYSPRLEAPQEESRETGAADGPADEERRLYRLSVEGGESYEFVRRDPLRAIDAYAFYLPRIADNALKARLRFRMLRSALAAGRKELAAELGKTLAGAPAELRSDEGPPLFLLAAELLARAGLPPASSAEGRPARERLLDFAPRLSNAALARFGASLAPGSEDVARLLEERRGLEEAAAKHPEILQDREAALGDGFMLWAREWPAAADAPPARAIVRVPLVLPELSAGELSARLLRGVPETPAEDAAAEGNAVARPLRAGAGGLEIARLEVADPARAEKLASLERRRAVFRWLVGLLIAAALGGGAALAYYLLRERQLVKLRERLLANVSHELKTPVTSVRMLSEMLSEEAFDPEKTRRFGQLLHSESLRLSRIIENVLDYSRLEHGGPGLEREPVELAALLRELGESFAPRAETHRVGFHLAGILADGPMGAAPAELVVATNAPAVERIVSNLLDNALKYGRSAEPEIRLGLARDEEFALVTVSDNGPGIPARERERVFEPFYRLAFDNYAVQGAGLGLSIARSLARGLGGELRLESREGAGCAFTLSLPLGTTSPDEPKAPPRLELEVRRRAA